MATAHSSLALVAIGGSITVVARGAIGLGLRAASASVRLAHCLLARTHRVGALHTIQRHITIGELCNQNNAHFV